MKRLRVALGTFIAIEAVHSSQAAALAGIEAAFEEVIDVERRMHPHARGSDLARINEASPGTPVAIDPDTCWVLSLARHLHDLSQGVFDPCLPERPGGLPDLQLESPHSIGSRDDRAVVVCHSPVAIDLGGIAKGHAVDRAIGALQRHGCLAGLVNAGGDLRVFGRTEAFRIRRTDGVNTVAIRDCALAVSDTATQNTPREHRGYYVRGRQHAIIVRTSAAVSADTAAVADALTKCAMLCDPEVTDSMLRALGARLY